MTLPWLPVARTMVFTHASHRLSNKKLWVDIVGGATRSHQSSRRNLSWPPVLESFTLRNFLAIRYIYSFYLNVVHMIEGASHLTVLQATGSWAGAREATLTGTHGREMKLAVAYCVHETILFNSKKVGPVTPTRERVSPVRELGFPKIGIITTTAPSGTPQ